jgi:hypothetical protein
MKKQQVDHVLRAAGRTLLAQTKMGDDLRERIRVRIDADFAQPAAG